MRPIESFLSPTIGQFRLTSPGRHEVRGRHETWIYDGLDASKYDRTYRYLTSCQFCSVGIYWDGKRWWHTGTNQPGHVARPSRG